MSTYSARILQFTGFLAVLSRLRSPKYRNFSEKLPKVSGQTAEIPVFEETIGGDWFDRHCAVGAQVVQPSGAHEKPPRKAQTVPMRYG